MSHKACCVKVKGCFGQAMDEENASGSQNFLRESLAGQMEILDGLNQEEELEFVAMADAVAHGYQESAEAGDAAVQALNEWAFKITA